MIKATQLSDEVKRIDALAKALGLMWDGQGYGRVTPEVIQKTTRKHKKHVFKKVCPECGFEAVGPIGLGIHRRKMHDIAGKHSAAVREIARAGKPEKKYHGNELYNDVYELEVGDYIDMTQKLKDFGIDHERMYQMIHSRATYLRSKGGTNRYLIRMEDGRFMVQRTK